MKDQPAGFPWGKLWPLAALTGAAFILRVWGAASSIAYVPDTQIVREALGVGQVLSGDPSYNLNMGAGLKYPLTLPVILLGVYGGIFLVTRAAGTISSVSEFASLLFSNRSEMHLVAVVVVALLGALVVPALYIAARSIRPKHSGWMAAALGAFSPLLVQFGHQARPHVPLASFSFLAVMLLVPVSRAAGRRLTLAATVVVALTVGTLQNGALILAPLAVAWVCRWWHLKNAGHWSPIQYLADLLLNSAILGVLLLILYPSFLSEFVSLARGIAVESDLLSLGAGSHSFGFHMFSLRNLPALARQLVDYEPLLAALALPAAILMLWKEHHRKTLWAVSLPFPGMFLIAFGLYSATYPRMLAPLVPFLIVPVAYLAEEALQTARMKRTLARSAIYGTLAIVLLVSGLVTSVRLDWVLSRTDTRTQASQWIRSNAPEGIALISDFQLLELTPSRVSLERQQRVDPESLGTYNQWLLRLPPDDYPAGTTYDIVDLNAYPVASTQEVEELVRDRQIRYALLALDPQQGLTDSLTQFALNRGTFVQAFCPDPRGVAGHLPDDISAPVWKEVWAFDRPGPIVAIVDISATANATLPVGPSWPDSICR